MDSRDLQEICRVLRSHEEHIHCNRSSLFNLAAKIHEIEESNCITGSRNYGVSGGIKQQLAVVEAECSLLQI
jgi:hypothetical protein